MVSKELKERMAQIKDLQTAKEEVRKVKLKIRNLYATVQGTEEFLIGLIQRIDELDKESE